jgi:hypothetical protein
MGKECTALSNPAPEGEGFCSSGKSGSFPGEPPGPRQAGLKLPGRLSLPAALIFDPRPFTPVRIFVPATPKVFFSRSGPGA